ncbi:hypothetical protein FPV67DRAFT_783245 [Lyophyllum atratum]|nr:hypothetical protein FPV67DRAFT_783245 [Lyophyllum atratum]
MSSIDDDLGFSLSQDFPGDNFQETTLVRDYFEYSMPTLTRDKDHTPSRSTRLPASFDRHLEKHLRIDRVVYLPAFLADLKAVAEDALTKYIHQFPLPPTAGTCFPDHGLRERSVEQALLQRILNEKSVEEIYSRTVTRHCSIVASTLEFQLPVWSSVHLRWQTIHGKEENENHAIADGFLEISDTSPASSLPMEYLDVPKDFPVIGVWEFKNMRAGSIEVFEAILEHATMSEFPWEGCQMGNFCAIDHPVKSGGVLKTWSKMGPDASQSVVSPPVMPPPPSHPIDKVDRVHASHMVQQVIAEMVKHDTTFACLHSGHSEVYFKRDRKNKTLYVSDIVQTDAPGHGRLITGLFIAMLRDAKERSAQMKHGHPPTWYEPCPSKGPELSPKNFITEARTRQWLILTSTENKKCPVLSFCPRSPYFRSPSVTVGATDFTLESPVVSISISPQHYTSKGTLSISGRVFPGIRGHYSKLVVVKCKTRDTELARLRNEDQAYRDLAKAGVTCIPQLIGLFLHANTEGNPIIKAPYACLVIEDVGSESLEDWWKSEKCFPESTVQDTLKALKQFHTRDYCYGKLALHDILILPENLRRNGRSPIYFVSLGSVYKTAEAWKKEEELKALERLLRNPLKHQLTEAESGDPSDDGESEDDSHITQRPRLFDSETTSSTAVLSRRME